MIDNMRVDGKFMHGNDIPEGQGAVTELLAECYDLSYNLRVTAEIRAEEEAEGETQANQGVNSGAATPLSNVEVNSASAGTPKADDGPLGEKKTEEKITA
jgi:hypothetical protein